MTHTTGERLMSKADAASLALFMVAGAAVAVWTAVTAVARIIEVLPGRDVRVFAEFFGTSAEAPIGPDGAAVPVELDTAWVTAAELPGPSVWALVAQQVVLAVAVAGVVACLLVVTWNILHGVLFCRLNTRLITTAGVTAFAGAVLVPFLGNIGANGAFARISERTFDNVLIAVEPFTLVALAFVAALASLTFTVGDRLRRETEGLV
ncbi:hypothetical protein [Microbacterium aureliae]